MPGALEPRIVDEIERLGPMPFDRYMELCLYDPHAGFFGSGRGAPGADADFITSPEVTPAFGRYLGRWATSLGVPAGTPLIEVGAGSGALLTGLLPEWDDHGPVHALERSATARETLAAAFPEVRVGSSLHDLPPGGEAVVIGNEVLDNMPVALARRSSAGWTELAVDAGPDGLGIVTTPARPTVASWCETTIGERPGDGLIAAQVAMTEWLGDLLGRFDRVHGCFVDYAATTSELLARSPDEVVRAYRDHRSTSALLAEPGRTDLTVDVNIDAVVQLAGRFGADVDVVAQRSFLTRHGAEDDIEALRAAEHDAARHGRTMDQLTARSERIDLDAVLDPRGLGGFSMVLIDHEPTHS